MDQPELLDQYVSALVAGDEHEAATIIATAQQSGMTVEEIYLRIFTPSMYRIGELWAENQISVAQEHIATAITETLISQLTPRSDTTALVPQATIVLGCVAEERHALGLRMLADMFRHHGWRVLYLGADVPSDDWIDLVGRCGASAVGISAQNRRLLQTTAALIQRLRQSFPELILVLGGALFNSDPALAMQLGGDVYDPHPLRAVEQASALLAERGSGRRP